MRLRKGLLQRLGLLLFCGVFFSILLLSFCLSCRVVSASSQTVEVYALDTVAGSASRAHTSRFLPDERVIFEIERPDSTVIRIPAVSNSEGIAYGEISDYYTRIAGNYKIRVLVESTGVYSRYSYFDVFSAPVSSSISKIHPLNYMARSGREWVQVSVKLTDKFGNPVSGHEVRLLASDNLSEIDYISPSRVTGSDGIIYFKVKSASKGTVVYTAYDSSADIVLDARSRVAFFDDLAKDFLVSSYGSPGGPVESLRFDDIPTPIGAGEIVNFTLTAIDNDEQIFTNYDSTVRFSVLSDNGAYVTLPDDYQFTPQDLGSHVFSLILSFQLPGVYEIEARDLDDPSIFGTYIFDVQELFPLGVSPSSSSINLVNPVSGTYSNNIIVVSGTAPPSSRLVIYDNNIQIGTITSDFEGEFVYTTPSLVDGDHNLYLAILDSAGAIVDESRVVQFRIDTSAPEILDVSVSPPGDIFAGDNFSLVLKVSDQLSQAAVIFADNIYELQNVGNNVYSVSLSAPLAHGDYYFDFILLDDLGNESRYSRRFQVSVLEKSAVSARVGAVSNLVAVPYDSRVTLNWIKPLAHDFPIQHYRIFYGGDPSNLNLVVDTFTDSTTWYVPNLVNGAEYYFAVLGVDIHGNLGEQLSNVVRSVPSPPVVLTTPPDIGYGLVGEDELLEMDSDVSDSGPDVFYLLLVSAIFGGFLARFGYKFRFFGWSL